MTNHIHEKITLKYPHLILCEGLDAKLFMIWFLNSDILKRDPRFARDIQVEDFGGVKELKDYLSMLQSIKGYGKLKSILILRDAEQDAALAVKNIQKALEFNSMPVPQTPCSWTKSENTDLSISFMIFPSCECTLANGTLEDLCLEILNDSLIINEVEIFLQTIQKLYKSNFSKRHKNKLHTYFSVTDDYVSFKLGEAARAGAFDWSHPKMKNLATLISQSFQPLPSE